MNFTVLYSYAHPLHKRKEPYIAIRVVVCDVWPAAAIWQLLLPLLSIVIEAIRTKGSKIQIKEALAFSLGSYAEPEEHFDAQDKRIEDCPELSIGDLVTGAMLLTQSITSLWLFDGVAYMVQS